MSTETTTAASAIPEISVNPEDFDRARVVIHDPVSFEFTVGEGSIKNTMSKGCYLNDDGQECELYFPAPPQNCFGVNYLYEMTLKKEQQTPENAKGLQICYPATSMKTVETPTPAEEAFIGMMDALWELTVEKGRVEAEREDLLIPQPSAASFLSAEKRKRMDQFVKPPIQFPNAKDKKILDKSKPKRMYVKLITSGKGETLQAHSKFYGPGDKPMSALRFLDKRGVIEPCFKWEGVFWGAHGSTSPHGASLRFKLVEANYTPQTGIGLPSHRMLGKNNAPPREEEDDPMPRSRGETDGNGEAEGFTGPGEDDSNPVAALSAATKKAAPKAAAKPPIKVAAKPKPVVRPPQKAAAPAAKPAAKPPVKKALPAKAAPVKAPVKRAPAPEEEEPVEVDAPEPEVEAEAEEQ